MDVNKQRLVWLALVIALVLIGTGCTKKTPVEVTDMQRQFQEAKDACATVYAADDLALVEDGVLDMNDLVGQGKMRKARKSAEALSPQVSGLRSTADQARSAAKQDADQAMAAAKGAMDAASQAEASKYAADDWAKGNALMDQAKAKAADPCAYGEAAKLAADAKAAYDKAASMAMAEKKRIAEEEARRRAEEEARRRAEEEARRRAEEEARRNPPTYVVQRGDHLWGIAGMDIVYSESKLWPVLYDANGNMISDPNLIYPGQELTIPRGMSEDELWEKVRQLWAQMP